jgi:preprotein translocase subunit SecA
MVTVLQKLLGDPNDKALKKLAPLKDRVNALEPEYQGFSDGQLRDKTAEFRSRLAGGESLDDMIAETFAAVREAARRNLGQRHYDVQLTGGMVLHQGQIAEMKTGEGKTLVSTLAVYANALTSQGVHVVTVNDYLARRDPVWMGPIYHALGLSVGCLQHDAAFLFDPEETGGAGSAPSLKLVSRKDAYEADVTYGTNN